MAIAEKGTNGLVTAENPPDIYVNGKAVCII